MSKIYLPSNGPEGWRRLLAKPDLQWAPGYSAMTLATCWEAAEGLPPEIASMFEDIGPQPELLLALPEYKIPLPGAKRGESQSDVFALVRAGAKTVATTIEGKVDEPFDKPLGKWLTDASEGKRTRLAYICDLLGLTQPLPHNVYYQLLHRAAAAVIEARRFKADAACMIVHSFSPSGKWFDEFERFVALFGLPSERGRLLLVRPAGTPPLYVGWSTGHPRFLAPNNTAG